MATPQYIKRDLDLEKQAVDKFIKETGKKPESQKDWDKVAESAYGIGYVVRNGQLQVPSSVIPDNPDKIGVKIKYETLSPTLTEYTPSGGYGLVKFQSDPDAGGPANASTVFLVDAANKTLRPFVSEQAFNTYFAPTGLTLEKASGDGYIQVAPNSLLSNGMAFSPQRGFSILTRPEEHIQNDGSIPSSDKINTDKISQRYGVPYNEQSFKDTFKVLDGFLGILKQDNNSGINANTIDEAMRDQDILSLYTNALAFGGYEMSDIYRDLKRRELLKQGDKSMKNVKVIDESLKADSYYGTAAGSTVKSNPLLQMPAYLGNMDSSSFNYSVYNMPDEVFETLVPPIDWTSPEAKEEASKIEAAYYDVLMKQLEAKTEQEKAVADYSYQKFKENINRAYGWKLSDNAMDAWNQLQNMTTNMSGRGLEGSGIHNEMMDRYLRDVREQDERLRTQKMDTEEAEKMDYYRNYAKQDEIAQLSAEERQKWGLEPSAETQEWLSMANLQAQYPNTSVEDLKKYRSLILDDSGATPMYRSKLYQNLFANKAGLEGWLVEPQMGKEQYQQEQLLEKKLGEEEKAYEEFTKPESVFSKQGYDEGVAVKETPVPVTPSATKIAPVVDSPWWGTPAGTSAKWESAEIAKKEAPKYQANPSTYTYTAPVNVKPPTSTVTPPNTANPFFGISTSEQNYPKDEIAAKEYWRKKGYTGSWQ